MESGDVPFQVHVPTTEHQNGTFVSADAPETGKTRQLKVEQPQNVPPKIRVLGWKKSSVSAAYILVVFGSNPHMMWARQRADGTQTLSLQVDSTLAVAGVK